jgi:hypothetical protein
MIDFLRQGARCSPKGGLIERSPLCEHRTGRIKKRLVLAWRFPPSHLFPDNCRELHPSSAIIFLEMRKGFVERKGKIAALDRSFDLSSWQSQPPKARFEAAWEIIVHASRKKGVNGY